MLKKYIVRLTPEEREHLQEVIKKLKGSGQKKTFYPPYETEYWLSALATRAESVEASVTHLAPAYTKSSPQRRRERKEKPKARKPKPRKNVTTYPHHANTMGRIKNNAFKVANTFKPCLRNVETVAWRRAYTRAPEAVRKHPLTFCLTLAGRKSRSAWLPVLSLSKHW